MPEWHEVDGGEYNEITATHRGCSLTVFSDRDSERWGADVDGHNVGYDFISKSEAIRAAILEAEHKGT
jgi:hypothetical protein